MKFQIFSKLFLTDDCDTCVLGSFIFVQLFATQWTVTCQAPLFIGFSKQEYWSGFPCPPPGDPPNPGMKPATPVSPALAGKFFTASAIWEAQPITAECVCSNSIPIKSKVL